MSDGATFWILSTGSELVAGRSIDANGPWIARALEDAGFRVAGISLLPDTTERLQGEIRRHLDDPAISGVILTGGLGPTDDDLTVDTLATIFDRPTHDEPLALARLEERIERNSQHHPEAERSSHAKLSLEATRKQIRVIEGCEVLANPTGLAPGQLLSYRRHSSPNPAYIAVMPGFPQEMLPMFPQLLARLNETLPRRHAARKHFFLYGVGESQFQSRFMAEEQKRGLADDFTWGVTSADGRLKIFFESSDEATLKRLDDSIHSCYADSLLSRPAEEELHELALTHHLSVGVAESCTGGSIAKLFTDRPGSSSWFTGGIVAYSNRLKESLLGVDQATIKMHGAVSSEVVEEMALGCCESLAVDYAVAISGIAGPGGGSAEKPVGTIWVAVASRRSGIVESERLWFPVDRDRVRRNSTHRSIFKLLRLMQKEVAL